ncbi:MAG TPA: pitrilysin family protein [Gemmatimonadaceae bacterium]|jgi:zinc protease
MITTRNIACASLALLIAVAASQAQGRTQPAPRPPVAPRQEFTFPHVVSHTLPNGLHLYVVEDHSTQVVAVRAAFAIDSTFDPPGKEGLYQVTLGALREGTTLRTTAQLADASARIGTAVSPTAFTTVPAAFEQALSVMGEMLMHPSFEATAIDRRKASVAATFRTLNARAATPARALLYSLLDGRDDPLARSQYATEGGVATITRQDVQSFYNEHLGPSTMSLAIVGDVTEENAVALATKVFGGWTKSATATRPVANPPVPTPMTIYLRDIPNAQTYLYVGTLGPRRTSPDAYAADVLALIASTRFTTALRQKRSLIYSGGIDIAWKPAPRASEFFGNTTVPAVKTDSALVEWIGVLRGLRGSDPVSESELEAAINLRVGSLWTKSDGSEAVAMRIGEARRANLPPDFLGLYAAGVTKVTRADIAAAAMKYIDVDHLVIVVTGDRKTIEATLRATNLAPIVVVDANGKPVSDDR